MSGQMTKGEINTMKVFLEGFHRLQKLAEPHNLGLVLDFENKCIDVREIHSDGDSDELLGSFSSFPTLKAFVDGYICGREKE